jgi:hypothetical protein
MDNQRFSFVCDRCNSVLEASVDKAGSPGRCPSCGDVMLIPSFDSRTGLRSTAQAASPRARSPVHAYAAAGQRAPKLRLQSDDTWCIVCPKCSCESQIDSDQCDECGMPFTLDGAHSSATPRQQLLAASTLTAGALSIPLALCAAGVGATVAVAGLVLSFMAFQAYGETHPPRRRTAPTVAAGLAFIGLCLATAGIAGWI